MARKKAIEIGASLDRFEKLLAERLKPETDSEIIDKRIWDLFGETWSIMFTDLSGFSRNTDKFGIIHFLQMIYEAHRILIPIIDDNDGILLKDEGDSLMILFRNVEKAFNASLEMQNILKKYNIDRAEEEKILLCVATISRVCA
ncbi:MAG: hypothetical protein F6K39_15100 [Okeania sp. SIO3B3]|nr:hypothetical protein [Okeania sp. SIO3B3]